MLLYTTVRYSAACTSLHLTSHVLQLGQGINLAVDEQQLESSSYFCHYISHVKKSSHHMQANFGKARLMTFNRPREWQTQLQSEEDQHIACRSELDAE